MIFTLLWFLLAIPLIVYGAFRLFFKNRNEDRKYKKQTIYILLFGLFMLLIPFIVYFVIIYFKLFPTEI